VLTAYLQIPYQVDAQADDYQPGEREVRRNVVRIIRDHLREGFSDVSWCGHTFRFGGAVFDGGDLTGARFPSGRVTFHGARSVGGTFHFNKVQMNGAQLWFTGARFEGGGVRSKMPPSPAAA